MVEVNSTSHLSNNERNLQIVELWNTQKISQDEIAEMHCLSTDRVKTILSGYRRAGFEVYSSSKLSIDPNISNILEMWNSGQHSYESIALNLDVENTTVRAKVARLKSLGLVTFIPRKKLSKKEKIIKELWNSCGHTYATIGAEMNVSRERIRQILAKLKRQGEVIVSTAKASAGRTSMLKSTRLASLSESDKKNIIQLYHDGLSFTEIVQKLRHIDKPTIDLFIDLGKKSNILSHKLRVYGEIRNNRENISAETKKREEIIISMRSENSSLEEISIALGISKINVTRLVKNMKLRGIYIPNSRDSGNPLPHEEIMKRVDITETLLDEGKSPLAISKYLKVNAHSLNALIYEYLVDKS